MKAGLFSRYTMDTARVKAAESLWFPQMADIADGNIAQEKRYPGWIWYASQGEANFGDCAVPAASGGTARTDRLHVGQANYLFVDGHVETISAASIADWVAAAVATPDQPTFAMPDAMPRDRR